MKVFIPNDPLVRLFYDLNLMYCPEWLDRLQAWCKANRIEVVMK